MQPQWVVMPGKQTNKQTVIIPPTLFYEATDVKGTFISVGLNFSYCVMLY